MNFTFWSYAFGEKHTRERARLNGMIAAQGIHDIRSFTPDDIEPEFVERHAITYANPRAPIRDGKPFIIDDGCCIWKPYLFMKVLDTVDFGDIVLYMDTGDILTGPPVLKQYLVDKTAANKDFATIQIPLTDRQYTKRDCFVIMGCDEPKYWDSPQRECGFIGVRKSWAVLEFMGAWMTYIADPRVSAHLVPNTLGENLQGFVDHRGEQSIFSLLLKKLDVKADWLHQGLQSYGLNHMLNIDIP